MTILSSNNFLRYLGFGLVLINVGAFGQAKIDFKSYQEKYKDDDVVYLVNEENYQLDISGDELKIKSNTYMELLFLTENSSIYAQREVRYVDYFSEILKLNAYTSVPTKKGTYKKVVVKEIDERKNTSEGVFYDDVHVKSFTFLEPIQGAIGVLNYEEKIKDPHFLGKFYFAMGSPIEKSSFSVRFHKDIDLRYKLKNPSDDIAFSKKNDGNYIIYSWTRNNIKKVKGESQAKSASYEIPHIIIHIAEYKGKSKSVKILGNTKDLYNQCYSMLQKGFEEPNEEIKRLTDSLTIGLNDPLLKMRSIYYYVQQNLKYIAIEDGLGGFIPRKPSLVCSRKYGDCKDLANLLWSMLNYAQIPAFHVFIGTNDIPYRFDEDPIMSVANHMIIAVWLSEKWYFLDGTANFLSYKYPSDFVQGKQALIAISADSFRIEQVPIISSEINCVKDTIHCYVKGDTLMGTGIKTIDGLTRCSFISSINAINGVKQKEFFENYLELGQNNCIISNVKVFGKSSRDSTLKLVYDFKIPKYTNQNDGKIFVNLNVERTWDNSEIDTNVRTREFIFDQTVSHIRYIKFEIPSSYVVNQLPKEMKSELEKYGFTFSFSKINNEIVYNQRYWFNVLEINKGDFKTWNTTTENLYKAYGQTLVLTKLK